jgi:hypothetical protein
MLTRVSKHLSFANVVAVMALFIALGSGAYAAKKLSGKSIKNNSIPAKKLKKNVLTNLEKCPAAAPSATADLCYGPIQTTGGGDWDTAMRSCQSVGLRIPDLGEALLVTAAAASDYIWTSDVSDTGPPSTRVIARTAEAKIAVIAKTNSAIQYRCITTPST